MSTACICTRKSLYTLSRCSIDPRIQNDISVYSFFLVTHSSFSHIDLFDQHLKSLEGFGTSRILASADVLRNSGSQFVLVDNFAIANGGGGDDATAIRRRRRQRRHKDDSAHISVISSRMCAACCYLHICIRIYVCICFVSRICRNSLVSFGDKVARCNARASYARRGETKRDETRRDEARRGVAMRRDACRGETRRDETERRGVALSLSIIFPRYRTASRLRSHRTDCERLVQLPTVRQPSFYIRE